MKRKLIIGAGTLAVLMVTSIAFAAWTSDGEGSGTATSTAHIDSEIAPGDSGDDLYPGADKSFTVTIDNPNDYPVIVTAISGGSSDAVVEGEDEEAVTVCAAGSVTSDARSNATGLAQTNAAVLIAGNGSGTYALDSHMINSPEQGCESQSFNLPLTADLVSAAS